MIDHTVTDSSRLIELVLERKAELRLSRNALAKQLGVTNKTIIDWEHDPHRNLRLTSKKKLADWLNAGQLGDEGQSGGGSDVPIRLHPAERSADVRELSRINLELLIENRVLKEVLRAALRGDE